MKLLLLAASAAAALTAVPAMAQDDGRWTLDRGRWSFSLETGANIPVDGELNGGRNVAFPDMGVINPALTGEAGVLRVNPVQFEDVYDTGWAFGGELAYGWSENSELFATLRYTSAEGGDANFGRVTNLTTPGLETVPLNANFDDLNVWTGDIGYRQYFGQGPRFKPYIAGRVGAAYTEGISASFSSPGFAGTPGSEFAFNDVTYYDDSWSWTVGADLGVNYQANERFALQAEVGLRYISDLSDESGPGLTTLGLSELNQDSGSSVTAPVMIRGRYTW